MTHLINHAEDFPAQAVAGFADANAQYVKPVFGGVVRSTLTAPGKVALVVGGGSGHYPAFAGWVGHGFADGAVCGNIFSSPSASQAYAVCRAADRGAGVLIGFGNYAGDVLHFGQAIERLKADGIDARTVVVTDDIASAPPSELPSRRGIAGDFPIFKLTGAAAEAGLGLEDVVRVFDKANAATRSFGVAFAGCTLPGADHPLFTVEDHTMGVGLGIHGEPGIRDEPLGTADEVAEQLVAGLLADRPARPGDRVLPVLNGLGATKYEELFVLWNSVAPRLRTAGLTLVTPQVGEFVTSLDMAGVSLTLTWLDEELEQLWQAPCDSPAFRHGSVGSLERDDGKLPQQPQPVVAEVEGSSASQRAAARVVDALTMVASAMKSAEQRLGDLDAVAGDGDHGLAMVRGSQAAVQAATDLVAQRAGAQTTLSGAGAAWSDAAGGTSGALWGALLTAMGSSLGDHHAVVTTTLAQAASAGLEAVQRLGAAQPGDKTLVDALLPAVRTFGSAAQSGANLRVALSAAAAAAETGAQSTVDLVARLGRARPLGERSRGTLDPGAESLALIVRALAG